MRDISDRNNLIKMEFSRWISRCSLIADAPTGIWCRSNWNLMPSPRPKWKIRWHPQRSHPKLVYVHQVNSGCMHYIYWLVVTGTLFYFIFPYIGNFIIPSEFHIFQRVETTNHYIYIYIYRYPFNVEKLLKWKWFQPAETYRRSTLNSKPHNISCINDHATI